MNTTRLLGGLAACALAAFAWAVPGSAADAAHDEIFVGVVQPRASGCQPLHFHVMTVPGKDAVAGYVFVMDGQDTMSRVTGTVATDGMVHLQFTPLHGNGPSGTMEATKKDGKLIGAMNGTGCSAFAIALPGQTYAVTGSGG